MLKPLDDVRKTVSLIASVAQASVAEVKQRLTDESAEIGTNVNRCLLAADVPLYVTSQKLDDFYRDSDAFLYETTVWNTCTTKQNMRNFVASRLRRFGKDRADVFCFGDGLGFDSAHLALDGHRVRYFEPSLRCQQYASEVFQSNGVAVTSIEKLDDIRPASLDGVVCLDVLEHVSQPESLVKLFHTWLKPDGLLFVHAPFWAIHWTRPTHLRENRYLSGDLKRLYSNNGFRALDSSIFWDPIVFQKSDHATPFRMSTAAAIRIALGKLLLAPGRWDASVHMWIARKIARAPQEWITALRNLDC